ncbi:MAG: TIGR03086 family metal-binding protein [Acidimicrobiales bacterium]
MDGLKTLEYSLQELRDAVASLDDSQMDAVSNCEPWTVRQLASHALNNQLFWAGLVTGQQIVAFEDSMGAVPIEGALAPVADDVVARALAMWKTDGVLDSIHATPLGEVPGSVVIKFATIDAAAHAWDLSASVDQPIEFAPQQIPSISAVVAATCTDGAREHGLIKAPTEIPADATDTERLMAAAGRTIRR